MWTVATPYTSYWLAKYVVNAQLFYIKILIEITLQKKTIYLTKPLHRTSEQKVKRGKFQQGILSLQWQLSCISLNRNYVWCNFLMVQNKSSNQVGKVVNPYNTSQNLHSSTLWAFREKDHRVQFIQTELKPVRKVNVDANLESSTQSTLG